MCDTSPWISAPMRETENIFRPVIIKPRSQICLSRVILICLQNYMLMKWSLPFWVEFVIYQRVEKSQPDSAAVLIWV